MSRSFSKNVFLILISLLIFENYLFALQDSIDFQSPAEKKIFEDYFDGDKNCFSLFYITGNKVSLQEVITAKQAYYDHLSKYKMEPYARMNNKKLAKTIYKDLHKDYLTRYELSTLFGKIFQGGSYNCLTASALFALCFEELNFNYEIKLLPQHVYIVLFPESDAIKVETTNPQQGFFIPDNRLKKQYVTFLKDQKIISETDYNSRSIEDIFQEHYYSEENITVENLAGLQYYNLGIELFMKEDFKNAFCQFEKALLLYPDERVKFMTKIALQNVLVLGGMKSAEDIKLLVKFPRYALSDQERELTAEFFSQFTNELLIEKGDTSSYNKGYRYILSGLNDMKLEKEISYIYYFELGRHFYRTGNTTKALHYFENAFLKDPVNIDAQSALIEIISHQLSQKPVREIYKTISQYYMDHEQLRNNNAFLSLFASVSLAAASQSYGLHIPSEGKAYLSQFETIFNESLEVNSYLISDTYISAAVYYFGRGNTTLARLCIDKGLKFSPDNYQLLQLKKSF